SSIGAPTDTSPPSSVGATAPAAADPTPVPPQLAASRTSSAVPRQRATVEAFAAATPLQQAAWLHEDGDYSGEQRLLQALLADPQITHAQRQEARLQLALSFLADEQPVFAFNVLEQISPQTGSQPGNDPFLSHTVFLRAETLARLGRNAEAVAAYEAFLQQHAEVTAVVEERIADAWLAAGDWQQAANALRRAANHAGRNWEKVRLLDRVAGILEGNGRWSQAAAVYDEILAATESSEVERSRENEFDSILGYRIWRVHRAGYMYRAGVAYSTAGDEEAAIARWRQALEEEPKSNSAYQSLIQLVNREVPVDLFVRGQVDVYAEAYFPAVSAFERFLEESPQDERAGQAWLGLGRAHMGLGQWDEAIRALEQVMNWYPACDCFGEAWLTRARLASAQGAPEAARRIYRTFARDHPDDPLAPEGLWQSALSAIRADRTLDIGSGSRSEATADFLVEAVADLLMLVDSFPDSPRAPDGLAVLGIGAFTYGHHGLAANSFERLLADYPDARSGTAAYWLGRARYALGEEDTARSLWQSLAAQEPETYYGVLAGLELALQGQPGQDLIPRMDAMTAAALPGDDGSRAFAENWLMTWHDAPNTTNASNSSGNSALPIAIAADPALVGGTLLLELDLRAEGLKLLEQVYWRNRDNPAALFPLMGYLEELGANRLSISAAYRLIQLSKARHTADVPLFIQRVAYPRHYSRLVEKEATDFEIDPLLLYSLILQESLFEPPARSFAGAHGLTQIIPTTGAEIAQRLGYPNYSTGLLNRPFVNVRFGAYYLRWVQDYAHENPVAALAGYNAGPGNARTWFDHSAPDEALFIERIPYNETRLYLQRILTHYAHYLRIYGGY
ncbi:MAG: tetratricopeptide repeat protein, partial [Caldilineaceae bacterium SB0664_bin_27]|nr:tetratricopeptide repeat protein [Caldilineaceae bacterium SB0664_bin_27]